MYKITLLIVSGVARRCFTGGDRPVVFCSYYWTRKGREDELEKKSQCSIGLVENCLACLLIQIDSIDLKMV